ncbi:AraC family transcriptional regulator [Escherichia albertii]|uniref:AraC family transcriptional regulator n=1 Tax=Escherichia albertii TaxID=208962 RepID=UPI00235FDAF3|nr:AraC family transcriptional regulator [Escherichia albertii]WDB26928.1 AraC family transcriptional regulator [Escherichia albertii]WDC22939.1 AraC family transcriptional regulator [Escherichia albertii]
MLSARRLILTRLPVNRVAAQCDYISASYIISVFRAYFGFTLHRMPELQEHWQHEK